MMEPLVQTQVIPYLRELIKDGHELMLLTFESSASPINGEKAKVRRAELAADGIEWHALRYHKRFSVIATAFDIIQGALFVRRMIAGRQLDILHARVHVPALMGAIARRFSRRKPKLLFDIRGFMPEEYTDAGVWPENGWLFKAAKRIERWLLKESDGFVVLTEKAREILFPESRDSGFDSQGRPVEVIPCCVDLSRFMNPDRAQRENLRRDLGVSDRFVITYVGSFGGWYMTDEMIEMFSTSRRQKPDSFALILTQRDREQVEGRLMEQGFTEKDFLVLSAKPEEVPSYLNASDAALSFIKACYSKQSSSPTKIAEYLAAGLPIVANSGVGDVDLTLEAHDVGVLIKDFNSTSMEAALQEVRSLGDVSERCRSAAKTEFDLSEVAGKRYRRLYRRIMSDEASR